MRVCTHTRTHTQFFCWVFRVSWLFEIAPSLPQCEAERKRPRGSNFARRVLSVMTHHPVPSGPHTGREEKVTITVINAEEGLPVTA